MASRVDIAPNAGDIVWAQTFNSLNSLLKCCSGSEKAMMLLSTCRNAYLTANALFVELQILMGDASEPSPIRAGAELLMQGAPPLRIKERFARSTQTVRQFEFKKLVWSEREAIWEDIEAAKLILAKIDPFAPDRINIVLNSTRVPDRPGDGWDHEVLQIDMYERQHLEPYFRSLDEVFEILRCCVELGWHTANSLVIDTEPQLELERTNALPSDGSSAKVVELAERLASLCGWIISDDESGKIINLIGGYRRPNNYGKLDHIALPKAATAHDISASISGLGAAIREALYVAHEKMCADFRPNIAKAPMPPPFEIELPAAAPPPQLGVSRPIRLERVRSATVNAPSDTALVAIAHLAVPMKKLNLKTYELVPEVTSEIKRDFRQALQIAENNKCSAIVFPEYSLPKSIDTEIVELANRHNLIIIGGLDGEWLNGRLCDRAIVAIPGEKDPYYQAKQQPSLEEEVEGRFHRDGQFYFFANSVLGEFCVIVCSDFLELDSLQAWAAEGPLPEVFIVVARNMYDELYTTLAKSDALRFYAAVAIANVKDIGDDVASCAGSGVVVPKRDNQLLSPRSIPINGKYLTELSLFELPLHAIRARSRGKPETGYFAVPRSAKRD